jgi:hypothetical protein
MGAADLLDNHYGVAPGVRGLGGRSLQCAPPSARLLSGSSSSSSFVDVKVLGAGKGNQAGLRRRRRRPRASGMLKYSLAKVRGADTPFRADVMGILGGREASEPTRASRPTLAPLGKFLPFPPFREAETPNFVPFFIASLFAFYPHSLPTRTCNTIASRPID